MKVQTTPAAAPRDVYNVGMAENLRPTVVWGQRNYRITRIAVVVGLTIGIVMEVLRFLSLIAIVRNLF
jgi:hypothetical protein